jgi:polyhydroxyalkanoate synthesis repressor PhaR
MTCGFIVLPIGVQDPRCEGCDNPEQGSQRESGAKYPNRRLYDTVESRYVTLADVRRLVVDRVDFVVLDRKTQQDITRSILLQVIAEQEHGAEPVMSRDFLSQLIRSYGGAMHGVLGSYLEQSVKLFSTQQREIREVTGQEHIARRVAAGVGAELVNLDEVGRG